MSAVALHGSAVVVGSSSPRNFLPWGSGLSVPLTARALGRFAWNPVKPRWNLSRNTPTMSWNTPLTVSPSLRVSTRVLVRLSTATPVATSANLNFVACACQEECTVGTHDFHDDHALWSGSQCHHCGRWGTAIMHSCCHAHFLTAPAVIAVLSIVHVYRC